MLFAPYPNTVDDFNFFAGLYFIKDIVKTPMCLEAHAVLHRGVPPGTQYAWLWNASIHLAELKGGMIAPCDMLFT